MCSLFVLFLIICVITGITIYSKNTIKDLMVRMDSIHRHIEAEDWASAYNEGYEMGMKFEEYSRIYGLYLDHVQIDNIMSGIIRLNCHITMENKNFSKVELETLKFFVSESNHRDIPSMYNIF